MSAYSGSISEAGKIVGNIAEILMSSVAGQK